MMALTESFVPDFYYIFSRHACALHLSLHRMIYFIEYQTVFDRKKRCYRGPMSGSSASKIFLRQLYNDFVIR